MKISVQFPTGVRAIDAIVMGKGLLGRGDGPSLLAVPRCVPGWRLSRSVGGWVAKRKS